VQIVTLLDYLPLWALFVLAVLIALLSAEVGFRLGRIRFNRSDEEVRAPLAPIIGGILGLLAFMTAITFGMAVSRIDARKHAVLEEAKAIHTTYLRSGLLPDPQRALIRKLLLEYLDVRVEAIDKHKTEQAVTRSEDLLNGILVELRPLVERDSNSILLYAFIESFNDMVDLHTERVTIGLHYRISGLVWLVLFIVSIISMGAVGYHQGLSGSRSQVATVALVLAFSLVFYLIADLERPQEGLLRVGQEAMVILQKKLPSL
jgi:hypothetical protein